MKLLTIQFDDAVDTTPFAVDADVTVAKDAATIAGKVLAKTQMADSPSLEGDFHITSIE